MIRSKLVIFALTVIGFFVLVMSIAMRSPQAPYEVVTKTLIKLSPTNPRPTSTSLPTEATKIVVRVESRQLDVTPLAKVIQPTKTNTLQPKATSTAAPTPISCSGAPQTRLTIGGQARTLESVKIRTEPGMSGAIISTLPKRVQIVLIGDPVCADQILWWRFKSGALEAWVAEGQGDNYFLGPTS